MKIKIKSNKPKDDTKKRIVLEQQRKKEILKKNTKLKEDTSKAKVSDRVLNKKEQKVLRDEIRGKLREKILARDNYTCQNTECGRNREDEPDIDLHVDHIIPLDKGGTNNEDNLETLCDTCNEKKSNKVSFEIAEKYFQDNIELASVKNHIASGKPVKEYFLVQESKLNRKVLHKYYELIGDNDCPQDCESCVPMFDTYFECFDYCKDLISEQVEVRSNSMRPAPKSIETSTVKMKCATCYLADRCKHFDLASDCVFDFTSGEDMKDAKKGMPILIQAQSERVMRAMMFERVDGGVPDKNTTTEMQILMDMYSTLHEMQQDKFGLNINIQGQSQGNNGANYMEQMMSKIFNPSTALPANDTKQIEGERIKALPEANTSNDMIADAEFVAQEKEKVEVKNDKLDSTQ